MLNPMKKQNIKTFRDEPKFNQSFVWDNIM